MMLIAVDTSTAQVGLAVYDGDQVLGEMTWTTRQHHTTELASALSGLLNRCGVTMDMVHAAAVAIGPGSFTSLRVGLSLVKGIALARNLPVVGIPTLDVIAAAQPVTTHPLIAVLQAGRKRIAIGGYQSDGVGWQAEGVELNRQSAAFCRSSGLTVHHGDLASARFPSASFDVITARHVIEHIPTPHQFMAELARLLKPGGCLVVETPNFSSLGWALFGTKWYATGIPYHLMLFSTGNLALLARRHGLEPLNQDLETSQKLFLNSLDILFERKGRPSRKIKWRRFLARLFVLVARRQGRGDILHSTFRRPL